MSRQTMSAELTNIKAGENNGLPERQFTGYASVFGNIDSYGDVVLPGAFKASLAEWQQSGKALPLLYGHDMQNIDGYVGQITDAKEDEHGLLVTGVFDDSDVANKVYRQVKGRRINELSFAFTILESEYGELDGQDVRFLKSVDLHEVSVVPIGANSKAQIQGVKSGERVSPRVGKQLQEIDRLQAEEGTVILGVKGALDRRHALTEIKSIAQTGMNPDEVEATLQELKAAEAERVKSWIDERDVPQLFFTAGDIDSQAGTKKWFENDNAKTSDERFATEAAGIEFENLPTFRKEIIDGIKSGDDATLTAVERLRAVERMLAQRNYAKANFEFMERLFKAAPNNAQGGNTMSTQHFSLKADNFTKEINRAATDFAERKSTTLNLASGDLASTFDPNILAQSQQPLTFLAALQTVPISTRNFTYYRQTARNNKAAVVPAGSAKPTTDIGLEAVSGELKVVAHLTKVDKYLARDAAGAIELITNELRYGVLEAVEKLVVKAISTDAAVVAQAFATDIHTTIRQGITKLESAGHTPAMVVLAPADLEALELAKATGSGEFLNPTAPSDRGTRTVWNLPVLVSTNLTAGEGFIMTADAARIYTDAAVEIETQPTGTDFETNLITIRCEGRFEPAVTRPTGIIKLDTLAA